MIVHQAHWPAGTAWVTPDGRVWRVLGYQESVEPAGPTTLPVYAIMTVDGKTETGMEDLPSGSQVIWFPRDRRRSRR